MKSVNNPITDQEKIQQVKDLLKQKEISEADQEKLSTLLGGLKVLKFDDIKIYDAGIEALSKALTKNQTVQTVVLDNNEIGYKGAVSIAALLLSNNTLQILSLRGSRMIKTDGTELLIKIALESNNSLQLFRIDETDVTPETFERIRALTARNKEIPTSKAPSTSSSKIEFPLSDITTHFLIMLNSISLLGLLGQGYDNDVMSSFLNRVETTYKSKKTVTLDDLLTSAQSFMKEKGKTANLFDFSNAILAFSIRQNATADQLKKVIDAIVNQASNHEDVITNLFTASTLALRQNATNKQLNNLFVAMVNHPKIADEAMSVVFNALIESTKLGATQKQLQNLIGVVWDVQNDVMGFMLLMAQTMEALVGQGTSQVQLQNFVGAIANNLNAVSKDQKNNKQVVRDIISNTLIFLTKRGADPENEIKRLLIVAENHLNDEKDFMLVLSNALGILTSQDEVGLGKKKALVGGIAYHFRTSPETMMNIVFNAFSYAAEMDASPAQLHNFIKLVGSTSTINEEVMLDIMANALSYSVKQKATPAQLQNMFSAISSYLKEPLKIRKFLIKAAIVGKEYHDITQPEIDVIKKLGSGSKDQKPITAEEINAQNALIEKLVAEDDQERAALLAKRTEERDKIKALKKKKEAKREAKEEAAKKQPVAAGKQEVQQEEQSTIEKFCAGRLEIKTGKKSIFRNALSFSEEIALFEGICRENPPTEAEKLVVAQTLLSIFSATQKNQQALYFSLDPQFKLNSDLVSLERVIRKLCEPLDSADKEIETTKNLILLNFYMTISKAFEKLANEAKYDVIQNQTPAQRGYKKTIVDGKELSNISPVDYQNHLLIMQEYGVLIDKIGGCIESLNNNIGGRTVSEDNALPWDYLDEYLTCVKKHQATEEKVAAQWITREKINRQFQVEGETRGFPVSKDGGISDVAKVNEAYRKANWKEDYGKRRAERFKGISDQVSSLKVKTRGEDVSVKSEPAPMSEYVAPTIVPSSVLFKEPRVQSEESKALMARLDSLIARAAKTREDEQTEKAKVLDFFVEADTMSDLFKKVQFIFKNFDDNVRQSGEPNSEFLYKDKELTVERVVAFDIEVLKILSQQKRSRGQNPDREEFFIKELETFSNLKAYKNIDDRCEELQKKQDLDAEHTSLLGTLKANLEELGTPIRTQILEITINCLGLVLEEKGQNVTLGENNICSELVSEMQAAIQKQQMPIMHEPIPHHVIEEQMQWQSFWQNYDQMPSSEQCVKIGFVQNEQGLFTAYSLEDQSRHYPVYQDHDGFFIGEENWSCRIAVNPNDSSKGVLLGSLPKTEEVALNQDEKEKPPETIRRRSLSLDANKVGGFTRVRSSSEDNTHG